ncbi:uncharacterized protein LOC114320988 [Camellia sinensis]|uniref:uncharacterized protein LOC114320988 n=1 Tax=Camellia sinensis TaxID=4442 RepID=UPI001036B213|nr:uncharacterized protein LOC114320988 [Camellia sinensis]
MTEVEVKPPRSIEVVKSVDGKKVVLQKPEEKLIKRLTPLYVRAHLEEVPVDRVLINNGAIVNILASKTLRAIGKLVEDLLPIDIDIGNFVRGSSKARGVVVIHLQDERKGIEIYWANANPFAIDVNNIKVVLYDKEICPIEVIEDEVKSQGKSLTNEEFKSIIEEGFKQMECVINNSLLSYKEVHLEHLRVAPAKLDDLKVDVQDPLEEFNLGIKAYKRTIYVNDSLSNKSKGKLVGLLYEYVDCFAWSYEEMLGLDRALVEHRLLIRDNIIPHKQSPRRMTIEVTLLVKEEIERLLKACFIRTVRNLNLATPNDEYPMLIANLLVDLATESKVLSFMDAHAGYNQIFVDPYDIHKTAFRCLGALGIFEWVAMPFGLKNAEATYQRAMNFIFPDLIGKFLEACIDDVVVKSDTFEEHLTHLRQIFQRMRSHQLKMNPSKCAFGVTVETEPWRLMFDGSRTDEKVGAGIVLISPDKQMYQFAY